MSNLREFIAVAIPDLATDDVAKLARHLERFGMRTVEDCVNLTGGMVLSGPVNLKPVQLNPFLGACHRGVVIRKLSRRPKWRGLHFE